MTLHNERSLHTCPRNQLEWFVNHTLPLEERAVVEAHLATCSACRAKLATLTELRRAIREMRTRTPETSPDLFARIELQIDLLPVYTHWQLLLLACWRWLVICAEHFQAQARLIRRELFWIPLLIMPLVGVMVYLPQSLAPGTVALLAALLTALGMAFLYGQQVDPAREITLVTQTSPRLVLAARFGLVFGYVLLLNCGLVLPFLTVQGIVTPGWFLTNWLAPLCCLSAIALFLSLLLGANASVLICSVLWTIRLLDRVQAFLFGNRPEIPWQQHYERFWNQVPLLFGLAILAVLLAFIVLERRENFTR